MTNNNRTRKWTDDGKCIPGSHGKCDLRLRENPLSGLDYRSRKSSCSEIPASGVRSSDTAYHWFMQSAWGSVFPLLSDARHYAVEPLGEAPDSLGTSLGQVPIECPKLTNDPLQGSLVRGRLVRRVLLVCPSVSGNRTSESHLSCDVNQQLESHEFVRRFGVGPLVNGRVCRYLADPPKTQVAGTLIEPKGGYK